MRASMADVEHALKGIDFPKSKNEILSYAKSNNASSEIVSDLQSIPDRTYNNAADLAQEFKGKQFKWESNKDNWLAKYLLRSYPKSDDLNVIYRKLYSQSRQTLEYVNRFITFHI